MTSVRCTRTARRLRLGATVSITLQRWPARNYFAELAPCSSDEAHPVDALLEQEPTMRGTARRARRLLDSIQTEANSADLLEFEAERNLLDATRVEAAFNLGFENGLLLGCVFRSDPGADSGAIRAPIPK